MECGVQKRPHFERKEYKFKIGNVMKSALLVDQNVQLSMSLGYRFNSRTDAFLVCDIKLKSWDLKCIILALYSPS